MGLFSTWQVTIFLDAILIAAPKGEESVVPPAEEFI
jgi:hypothetical protein